MNIPADAFFRMLDDDTRRRCLLLLARQGELCVCELTFALGLAQPKVSRHLAQLREQSLVSDRRVGQWVYYRLNPAQPAWMDEVLRVTLAGIGASDPFRADLARLEQMPNRPGSRCEAG